MNKKKIPPEEKLYWLIKTFVVPSGKRYYGVIFNQHDVELWRGELKRYRIEAVKETGRSLRVLRRK